MRELDRTEILEVGGAGIYTAANRQQFRSMVVGAIAGGMRGGAAGFAIGLVAGSINGYKSPHVQTSAQ